MRRKKAYKKLDWWIDYDGKFLNSRGVTDNKATTSTSASKTADAIVPTKIELCANRIATAYPYSRILYSESYPDADVQRTGRMLFQLSGAELKWMDIDTGNITEMEKYGSTSGVRINDDVKYVRRENKRLRFFTERKNYLALLSREGEWKWIGKFDSQPKIEFALAKAPVQGYGNSAEILPECRLSLLSAADDITKGKEVLDIVNAYHSAVESQGLAASPFFICSALRCSDGSHLAVSPPVLMIPNSVASWPRILEKKESAEEGTTNYRLQILSQPCRVCYRMTGVNAELWKSMGVTHLDIFTTTAVGMHDDRVPAFGEERITCDGFTHSGLAVGEDDAIWFEENREQLLVSDSNPRCLGIKPLSEREVRCRLLAAGGRYVLRWRIPVEKLAESATFRYPVEAGDREEFIPDWTLGDMEGADGVMTFAEPPALRHFAPYMKIGGKEVWHGLEYNREVTLLCDTELKVASSDRDMEADINRPVAWPRWFWYSSEQARNFLVRTGWGRCEQIDLVSRESQHDSCRLAPLDYNREMPEFAINKRTVSPGLATYCNPDKNPDNGYTQSGGLSQRCATPKGDVVLDGDGLKLCNNTNTTSLNSNLKNIVGKYVDDISGFDLRMALMQGRVLYDEGTGKLVLFVKIAGKGVVLARSLDNINAEWTSTEGLIPEYAVNHSSNVSGETFYSWIVDSGRGIWRFDFQERFTDEFISNLTTDVQEKEDKKGNKEETIPPLLTSKVIALGSNARVRGFLALGGDGEEEIYAEGSQDAVRWQYVGRGKHLICSLRGPAYNFIRISVSWQRKRPRGVRVYFQ